MGEIECPLLFPLTSFSLSQFLNAYIFLISVQNTQSVDIHYLN